MKSKSQIDIFNSIKYNKQQKKQRQSRHNSHSLILDLKLYRKSITKLAIGCIKKQNLKYKNQQMKKEISMRHQTKIFKEKYNLRVKSKSSQNYRLLPNSINSCSNTKKKKYDYGVTFQNQQTQQQNPNKLRHTYKTLDQTNKLQNQSSYDFLLSSKDNRANFSNDYSGESKKNLPKNVSASTYLISPFKIYDSGKDNKKRQQNLADKQNKQRYQLIPQLQTVKAKKQQSLWSTISVLKNKNLKKYQPNQNQVNQKQKIQNSVWFSKQQAQDRKNKRYDTKQKINTILKTIKDIEQRRKDVKNSKKSSIENKINGCRINQNKQFDHKGFQNTSSNKISKKPDYQRLSNQKTNNLNQNKQYNGLNINHNVKDKSYTQAQLIRNKYGKEITEKTLNQGKKKQIEYPKTETYTSRSDYNIDRLSNKLDCYIKQHIKK